MGGSVIDKNIDLKMLLLKRLNIHSTTLRNRSEKYKSELIELFSKDIINYFQNKKLKLITHKILDFNEHDLNEAHNILKSNANIGKVIIKI